MTLESLSRCPRCGARGVKVVAPLVQDGINVDVPYCGKCGRNWPLAALTPREQFQRATDGFEQP